MNGVLYQISQQNISKNLIFQLNSKVHFTPHIWYNWRGISFNKSNVKDVILGGGGGLNLEYWMWE